MTALCPECRAPLSMPERSIGICEECLDWRMRHHTRTPIRIHSAPSESIIINSGHIIRMRHGAQVSDD